MSASNNPPSCPLQTLLSLGQSLHEAPQKDCQELSLRQLVPVHQSLCQALIRRGGSSSSSSDSKDQTGSDFSSCISLLCVNQEEADLCKEILLHKQLDKNINSTSLSTTPVDDKLLTAKRQLLAVQYLLSHESIQSHPLEGLAKIVLPLLMHHLAQQYMIQSLAEEEDVVAMADEDTPPPIPPVLLEMLEALLDASFQFGSSSSSSSAQEGLRSCLDVCLQPLPTPVSSGDHNHQTQPQSSEWMWTVQGRVLIRLHRWFSSGGGEAQQAPAAAELLLQFLMDKCLEAMHSSCPSMRDMVAWLRPMTTEWLPYWLDHLTASSSGAHSLWKCLWERYLKITASPKSTLKQQAQTMISTTSILCVILPSLLTMVLPGPKSPSDTALPHHQPQLWQLIHKCLRQGIPRQSQPGKTSANDVAVQQFDQMLRRRGLYLLRLVVQAGSTTTTTTTKGGDKEQQSLMNLWKKYVLVMEQDQYLIDQIWSTLAELLEASQANKNNNISQENTPTPPPMTWHWTQLLLARIITSYDNPQVRKLALYRLFQGEAGISMDAVAAASTTTTTEPTTTNADKPETRGKKKTKGAKASNKAKAPQRSKGASLNLLSPEFVCDIVLVSFDSLARSVGTTIHITEGGELLKVDMIPLLSRFMAKYYASLDSEQRKALLNKIWHDSILLRLQTKAVVQVWECVAEAMATEKTETSSAASVELLPIDDELLNTLAYSLQRLFSTNSVVRVFQISLLNSLAIMLAHTQTQKIDPKTILRVLSLWDPMFKEQDMESSPIVEGEAKTSDDRSNTNRSVSEDIHSYLQTWLHQIGDASAAWISMVASTVAAAYVRGELTTSGSAESEGAWEPQNGASALEREWARAIVYLCTLVGRIDRIDADNKSTTASELLWPSIHKGLGQVAIATTGTSWAKADCVARALLLLEHGCRWQVLSGMGNGDLIIDKKTQQMMPPPPHVETLLADSVKFIMHHIKYLLSSPDENGPSSGSGSTRSGSAKKVSTTFANLITQIQTLHKAYPSSMAVSNAVDDMLKSSLQELEKESETSANSDKVTHMMIVYASMSSGATLPDSENILGTSRMLLHLKLRQNHADRKKADKQAAVSIFYFSKWGALSCLLPQLLQSAKAESDDAKAFFEEFSGVAFDSVQEIPADALMAFFSCITVAARHQLDTPAPLSSEKKLVEADPSMILRVIQALMAVMEESSLSQDTAFMLNEICSLIFQPRLLLEEYHRLERDPVDAVTPIRDAFRQLMAMAGTVKPHISRAALCHISAGWLAAESDEETKGIAAIPYRDDIVKLLMHKETKVDITAANQSVINSDQALQLPNQTDESSIVRAFILLFLSELPDPQDGLHPKVLTELIQHIIFQLFEKVAPQPGKKKNAIVMTGTEIYCIKMRGWQALCCLSRYITDDIAEHACNQCFTAMTETLHGQLRYFIEIFTLRCARKHPSVFGRAILDNIVRTDLSAQHVTSLMIVAGNLIVGRYQLDFFRQYEEGSVGEAAPLNQILAGVIPWLGSTQGFSRAIAQLLTHKLIPLVVDLKSFKKGKEDARDENSSGWLLQSIYHFLDENPEMMRLRKKQMKFFDSYEVDEVCTPEGVLNIPVDEGGEANPDHMVEIIKNCLKEVYEETHVEDAPVWKQVDEIIKAQGPPDDEVLSNNNDAATTTDLDEKIVTFQRKIIPLDELNVAMEGIRERRLRNVAGIKKQELIVCASLIDKIPNLAGFTRTAEIFAAEKLVIPDIQVCKMDNFVSMSVGAGDWIDIEECKEENLLQWLRLHKARGYYIVGLEQTSSSVSLEGFQFPPDQPIVLLLGKEKEGIPVEFLQVVDQCVEIPQMGIIRSLNVHVSGAIAIWEHTRQKVYGK